MGKRRRRWRKEAARGSLPWSRFPFLVKGWHGGLSVHTSAFAKGGASRSAAVRCSMLRRRGPTGSSGKLAAYTAFATSELSTAARPRARRPEPSDSSARSSAQRIIPLPE